MRPTPLTDVPRAGRRPRPLRPPLFAVGLLLLLLPGCGEREVRHEIGDVRRQGPGAGPAPRGASDEERFALGPMASPHGPLGPMAPSATRRGWTFKTPAGWTPLPAAPMRDHGWRAGPGGRVECTLSLIEGGAGGLAANVDRWRKQMSLPPGDEAALAALPTQPWLGVDARLVELDGAYRGMGGTVQEQEARLLGLIATLPRGTAFLKLVGPAGAVAVERERFLALAASLELGPDLPADGPEAPVAHATSRLSWTAPEGWVQQPARMMREVTYAPAAAPDVSVYVTLLVGTAGGTRANIDRWRGEVGQGPISDADLSALPRWSVLGTQAVAVELEGTFTGMSGEPLPGAALLGLVVERTQGSVFVKMTGPAAQVKAERERFRAFCESLRE